MDSKRIKSESYSTQVCVERVVAPFVIESGDTPSKAEKDNV